MLSWIESFAFGFVAAGVAYLTFRIVCSIVTWRYERYKQIAEACNNIDNAFENAKREEHS